MLLEAARSAAVAFPAAASASCVSAVAARDVATAFCASATAARGAAAAFCASAAAARGAAITFLMPVSGFFPQCFDSSTTKRHISHGKSRCSIPNSRCRHQKRRRRLSSGCLMAGGWHRSAAKGCDTRPLSRSSLARSHRSVKRSLWQHVEWPHLACKLVRATDHRRPHPSSPPRQRKSWAPSALLER